MDPGKLVSKVTEGVTNLQKDVFIKPAADLASAAVGGVGQVMSQPGAGAVLGGAGMAFGVPGLGALGGLFGGGQINTAAPSPAPVSVPQVITLPAESKSDNSMIMIIAAIGVGLVLTVALIFGLKKK